MNRFSFSKRKNGLFRPVVPSLLLFGGCMGLFLAGLSSVSETTEENYTESLRLAILRSAIHCYAMEGRYPESLNYLQEHYGLSWNEDQYLVDYEIIGSNLKPDVTIIPLHEKEGSK